MSHNQTLIVVNSLTDFFFDEGESKWREDIVMVLFG